MMFIFLDMHVLQWIKMKTRVVSIIKSSLGTPIKLPNLNFPPCYNYTATFLYQFLSGLVKSNDVCISPGVPSERDGRLQHGVWEGRELSGPGIRYEVSQGPINERNSTLYWD